jgi:hypothetical protein
MKTVGTSYHDSEAEYKAGNATLPGVRVVSVKLREETLVRQQLLQVRNTLTNKHLKHHSYWNSEERHSYWNSEERHSYWNSEERPLPDSSFFRSGIHSQKTTWNITAVETQRRDPCQTAASPGQGYIHQQTPETVVKLRREVLVRQQLLQVRDTLTNEHLKQNSC